MRRFSPRSGTDSAFFAVASGTMFRLPALASSSRRPLGPWHRAALFGAGLLLLWLALQLAPSAPPTPTAAPRSTVAAERLPTRPDAGAVGDPGLGEVATRPSRGMLRFGNVLAVLLLAGGGAWAVYLRRKRPDVGTSEASLPMTSLGGLPLAPGLTLRLVRVGEEVLLLGLAQGGITLLRRYDADEAPLDHVTGDGMVATSFADLLHRVQTPQAHG